MAAVTAATALISAIGAGFASASGTVVFSWSAAAIAGASSLVLGLASQVLAPKPPDAGSFDQSGAATRQFRQPTPERRMVYGEVRVSGGAAFIASSDNVVNTIIIENRFLHVIVMLASHEVAEIGEIIVDDVSIVDEQLDGDGNVISGTFKNKMRIKKYLGTTTQTADQDLIDEVPAWTSNHRLQGIAYLYMRYKYDREVYKNGIPQVSAWVRGKKVLDTRDSTEKFTTNIALQVRDYLTDTAFGFEVPSDRIDTDVLNDTANLCDEMQQVLNVPQAMDDADATEDYIQLKGETLLLQRGDRVRLSGVGLPSGVDQDTDYYVIPYQRITTPKIRLAASLADSMDNIYIDLTSAGSITGTQKVIKQAEPRYHGGGVIKTSSELKANIEEMLSGMGGRAIYAGGKWRILGAKYYSPTVTLTIDDLVTSISINTKQSKRDRFNRIQGIYSSTLDNGNPTDYPAVRNSTYETEDGEVLIREMALPFTTRPHTAQRLAKVVLERERQEIVFSASFNLKAFQVQAGDNVYLTIDRYGWNQKVFEVLEWSIGIDGYDNPRPVINMRLQENASAVYDWNAGEETIVDPAPNTNLPSVFSVGAVQGFSLDSILIDTQALDKTFKVLASWDASDNQFVLEGGFYEVEFRRTTESVYRSAGKVDGDKTEFEIPQLQPDAAYDIRVRAFNNVRTPSEYTTINNFIVGDTVTTDTEDWENETLARDGDDWENNTLTNEDWE